MYFSLILPIYNVEKYLRECVDSVLTQTFTDFEVILVNDGSKDNSGCICDEYALKDSRVKVIHKENGGQSTARNRGFLEAQGEYIIFLDSDDFLIDQNFLKVLFDKIKNKPDIVCYKYCKFYDKNKQFGNCTYTFEDIDDQDDIDIQLEKLVRKDAFFCSAWSKSVRREFLVQNDIKFDENSRCEDMDWYFNVITKAKTMAFLDRSIVAYRQRENSVTAQKNLKTFDDFTNFLETWYPQINQLADNRKKPLLSAMAKLYTNLMLIYVDINEDKCYEKLKRFSSLLNYTLNPRVKKISLVYKIIGLRATLNLLKFAKKMR